jgi:ferredoxin
MVSQRPTAAARFDDQPASAIDILQWPLIGALLRWRYFKRSLQILLLLVAAVVIVHGLLGPQLAPKNLATVLTWVHYRGLLIGALLAVGNAFCFACPMVLVRDLGRRLHAPTRTWPRWLARKWLALALFVAVLFAYELFDLWALPAATAWLVVGYFAAALVFDLTFKGATFCKYVCPVGQFNFVVSTLSPFEIRPRSLDTCHSCKTVDCIKGRRDHEAPAVVLRRGCELNLFVPTKVGNLDCTFCLDCVQACPHDNVAIAARVPGDELVDDRRRSSIGRLSRRVDLAALALVFTFGALLNAFAMVGPVYATEAWIAHALGARSELPVLGLIFFAGLVFLPAVLCAGAASLSRWLAPFPTQRLLDIAVGYAYALVPFGTGVWLAHYGFHFLTGVWTVVPVAQSAAIDAAGRAILGEPNWRLLGMRPGLVFPLQVGVVLLGALGSFMLVQHVSERECPDAAPQAGVPWRILIVGLAVVALWILVQPMEMRGTGLGG